ncbi:hypothetical protein [Pontibacter sp. G13]|uniref:hypothetical protein n=1 Tax=Pontibacter sp. G13 TaxID=3074898 RepID=UPI00288B5C82|nr:hypothetical protein [Pontibacter sp. G13]WNJ19488.1 hypothetical protein RJD25_03255 [Pontibacter sp. G13]
MNKERAGLLLGLLGMGIWGCTTSSGGLQTDQSGGSDPFWTGRNEIMVMDFEAEDSTGMLSAQDAIILPIADAGVTQGQRALRMDLKGDVTHAGITIRPEDPIDASQFEHFSLVFDATNLSNEKSAQIYTIVESAHGGTVRRSQVIPAGATETYVFELEGPYASHETGLRDDPKPWDMQAKQMKIHGLKQQVDFSLIKSIQIYMSYTIEDRTLVLDNIRVVESPKIDEDYLVGIVDKYGQAAKNEFEGKITSDEQLRQLAEEELAQLAAEGTMAGRSQFGGWSDGPKLEATGYFRAEKVNGKWALVDPEGYLFFSHGLANVRMANTTSFTGVDFRNESVRYRDPEDVTPEDSRGMVALGPEVTRTAYVAYPDRRKMFTELPSYDDPLANNYSYRREQHIGPFDHGETFSHYQANLERRYGEPTPGAHLEKWLDITQDRFLNWGFTSFGNWAAAEFYDQNRMPYFANGWIIGDFQTVKSGMDYWGPMPDVFDPEFERRAELTVSVVADEVKDNPWCVGVFIDNEKSWGAPGPPKRHFGIALHALEKEASESFIKAKFVKILKAKHGDIQTLNQAWQTDFSNWKALEIAGEYVNRKEFSQAMKDDLSQLTEAYASRYFEVVHAAMEEYLPNHLYMGCRFTTWGMTPEIRTAAKKYVDVFSYNFYHEALTEGYWEFLEDIDRPSIIGEFHIGTLESGLFHPGLIIATDHEDRARMYKAYIRSVVDNPYFVGAHWFQYLDSPTSGRAHDGENYNVGFVRITDVPYASMVEAAKELNQELYPRRYGESK